MAARRPRNPRAIPSPYGELETFQEHWASLTPLQRHRCAIAMYRLLKDPQAVHDAKLFPKP